MTILDLKSFLKLHMNKRPSYLCALDIGTKNTGIAITDLSWFLTARPLGQVQTSSFTRDFDKLLLQSSSDSSGSSIKKEKISGYIVGMPYHHHHYNIS
jgi:RNase H-fold protein (predicted Holliday junction resolvase)